MEMGGKGVKDMPKDWEQAVGTLSKRARGEIEQRTGCSEEGFDNIPLFIF